MSCLTPVLSSSTRREVPFPRAAQRSLLRTALAVLALSASASGLQAQARDPDFAFGLGLGYAIGDLNQLEIGTTASVRLSGRLSGLGMLEGTRSWLRATAGARVLADAGATPIYLVGGWFLWRSRLDRPLENANGPMIGVGIESHALGSETSVRDVTLYAEGRLLGKGPVRSTLFAGVRLRFHSN